jgi:hypothetical protein
VFIGPGRERFNDAINAGDQDALARKIEQLDAVAH